MIIIFIFVYLLFIIYFFKLIVNIYLLFFDLVFYAKLVDIF